METIKWYYCKPCKSVMIHCPHGSDWDRLSPAKRLDRIAVDDSSWRKDAEWRIRNEWWLGIVARIELKWLRFKRLFKKK